MSNLVLRILLAFVCLAFVFGIYLRQEYRSEQALKLVEQTEAEIDDLSIPPKLSARMNDPNWTIRHWIGADAPLRDCTRANDLMDEGKLKLVVMRKGRVIAQHHIEEYIASCEAYESWARELVTPRANKWCLFADTQSRFADLCSEWSSHGGEYLEEMRSQAFQTSTRYEELKHTLR